MNSRYVSTTGWVPRVSREDARRSPCPKCGATAGQFCKNDDGGFRGVNHAERAKAIRQAHLANAKATVNAIPAEAWNYARAYLQNLGRSSVVTGLTPCEEEIGSRAMTSMDFGRHLLFQHHADGKSLRDVARDWGKTDDAIERSYSRALEHFASRLSPLVSASCPACRRQMPEIVTNQCLRCPDCRPLLEDLWRQRAAHSHNTPMYSFSVTAKLLNSYAVLMVRSDATIDTIERARDEQLQRLAWVMAEDVPAHLKELAATAQVTVNEAWECIRRHRFI